MTNAMQTIGDELRRAGWHLHSSGETPRGFKTEYISGTQMLTINYKLYGSGGSMRLCRNYGKDPNDGVNWGVEIATLRWWDDDLSTVDGFKWRLVKSFTGKNKKGQLLKFAKEGLSAGSNV